MRQKVLAILKISLRNIRRHPAKNFIMGLIILLSCIIFFLTATMSRNVRENWRNFFAVTLLGDYHVTAYRGDDKDYTIAAFSLPKNFIPASIIADLAAQKINFSQRIKLAGLVYNRQKGEFGAYPVTLVGIDYHTESKNLTNLRVNSGRYEPNRPDGILVWQELANFYQWRAGDEVTIFLKDVDDNSLPFKFKISGIISNKTGQSFAGIGSIPFFPIIFVSIDHIQAILGVPENKCTEVAIWDHHCKYANHIIQSAQKYHATFFYGEQGFGVIYGIVGCINFIGLFMEFFILIILIVTTFNLNMMGFSERQKEIGTMLAIGAKPWWVVCLLLVELITLAVILFGIALLIYQTISIFIPAQLNLGKGLNIAFAGNGLHLSLVPSAVCSAFLTILATMFSSALYPIYLATQINPVEVFREAEL